MNEEIYEKRIDDAIDKAIANMMLEGFIISKEEKNKLKKEFLDTYKIKILTKKIGNKDGKR